MNYFLSLCLLFSVFQINAQEVALRGVVIADPEVIPLANIVVFRTEDSLFVKGDYLDTNTFEIKFNSGGAVDFFAKLTMPNYLDTVIPFKVTDSVVSLGVIKPVENRALDVVDVVYKKELYVRTMDGLTVNVEGTNLQTLTNLFEVLKASPKITSPDDERIEIIGKGSPLILVDRQAIISNDELKAIPANQIEKIEIITNPSAKYKAQGSSNGVIEVYTKNFHLEGYNMSIGGGFGANTQLKPSGNMNTGLSLKRNKFSLNGYFGGSYNSSVGFSNSSGQTTDDSNRSLATDSEFESQNTWQYYSLKAAYNVSEKQRLTMGVNGYGGGGTNTNVAVQSYYQNNDLMTENDRQSTNSWTWLNNSAFVNYTIETDTNNSNFELNLNYVNKVSNSDNSSSSNYTDIASNTQSGFAIRNDSRDLPNIGELRASYEHVFDTSGWKLSGGLSYSILVNGKKLTRFNALADDWIIDDAQSNAYDYTENIGAAFVEVTKNWDKISMRGGLRAEYTNLNGYSTPLDKTFIDSVYILPFPSASILYQANDKLGVTLSYDSGLDRPQFSNFDPFVVQSDSLRIDYGNPYLRPTIEQSIGLDFDLFYQYNLSLSYSYAKDPISSISFIKDNSFLTETTPWNAESEQGVSASLSLPFRLKWLSGWNSIWVDYTKYRFTPIFDREPFGNLTYGLYSYITVKLPKSFDITNRFHVNRWGDSNSQNNMVMNWGVRATKKFNGNKFQLFLDISNIIPPKYGSTLFSGNYLYETSSQNQFTTFKAGFYIKFGRLKAAEHIEESKSKQSDRL